MLYYIDAHLVAVCEPDIHKFMNLNTSLRGGKKKEIKNKPNEHMNALTQKLIFNSFIIISVKCQINT